MNHSNLNNLTLGSGKVKQITISEKVYQKKIEKIFLDNVLIFKKFLKKKRIIMGKKY